MLETNILNIYKNILDFFKSALAYLAVLSAFAMFFGFISLSVFLWTSDYLWIMYNVDYQTIAVWGFPTALVFFGLSLLGSVIYKERSKYEKILLLNQIIIFGIIPLLALITYFIPDQYKNLYVIILGTATTFIAFFIAYLTKAASLDVELEYHIAKLKILESTLKEETSKIFDEHTEEEIEKVKEVLDQEQIGKLKEAAKIHKDLEEKENNKYALLNKKILIYIFLLFVAATVWSVLSAKAQSVNIKNGNYQILAEVKKKQYGVLINNSSTFILVDLNNTDKLSIFRANAIDSLVKGNTSKSF